MFVYRCTCREVEHVGWSVERREGRRLVCGIQNECWRGETRDRATISSPIEEPACSDEELVISSSYPGPCSRAPTSMRRAQDHKVPARRSNARVLPPVRPVESCLQATTKRIVGLWRCAYPYESTEALIGQRPDPASQRSERYEPKMRKK